MLAPLISAFPISADGENASSKIRVYALAVEDLPPWATKQAIVDFIKGKVPDHNGRFLPTTAELAKRARAVMNKQSADEYKRIASAAPVEPEPEPMSEAERIRRSEHVAKMFAKYRMDTQ